MSWSSSLLCNYNICYEMNWLPVKKFETLQGLLLANNNQLSGSIQKELGQLASLQELMLSDNQLSGSIPKELGQLGLDYNEWSGSMSEVLRRLALV